MTQTTIVFDINLPDDEESHEWSYLELVQEHLAKNTDDGSRSNPFTEAEHHENKRLVEIARSLERKYGTMVTMQKSGSRKRVRIDDFLDPGDGYDTQDSFIDDSEAVDVYVAPNVSTKLGGFFVHEGVVEGLEDQNARIEAPVGSWQKPNPIARPVKKNKSKELLEKAVKRLSTPKVSPNVTRTKMQHLDSVFDAVLATSPKNLFSPTTSCTTPLKVENSTSDDIKRLPIVTTEANSSNTPQPSAVPTLPPSLPGEVINKIEELIKLAFPNGTQQVRMMSKPFNNGLLNLAAALNANKITPVIRSAIFGYMEAKLQWKRKSIARRLKKLSEANEDQKMNPLLDALSDAISRSMPALLESYAKDKELHTERMKVWQQENKNNENETGENQPNCTSIDGNTVKRNPKPGAPKKIFRWNEESRTLFHSIVTRRLESHQVLNIKGPREEYLKSLFPTLIQLWPDGWITNAALWRAALPVFQRFSAEHPVGNQVSSTTKPTPAACTATATCVQEINPKIFDTCMKPTNAVTSNKSKPGSLISRQSSVSAVPSGGFALKTTFSESVTSCTVTLQPIITTDQHDINGLVNSGQSSTMLPPPKSVASTAVNLQQTIKSTQDSKSGRPMVGAESEIPIAHIESQQTIVSGSPPCIQSLVSLKSPLITTPVHSSRPSLTKPSSVVQPINVNVSRTPLVRLSTSLTQPYRTTVTTAIMSKISDNNSSPSLTRSADQVYVSPITSVSTSVSSAADTLSMRRETAYPGNLEASESFLRVAASRRQTAPTALNRTQMIVNNATASNQRTDSQGSVTTSVVTTQCDKQVRQQVFYQPTAIGFSASKVDHHQQHNGRSNLSTNSCNPWLAATALLLQRSQPPPAHLHPSATTSYHLKREPNVNNSSSATHSGSQVTKGSEPHP